METDNIERFEKFILLIDQIHKDINRIKGFIVSDPELKGVHALWLYELLQNPSGLTATEIANKTKIDRSLVSREIKILEKENYIYFESPEGKRNYNSRIILTEKGIKLAERISDEAMAVQEIVGKEVGCEDRAVFYEVLEKFSRNMKKICENNKKLCYGN